MFLTGDTDQQCGLIYYARSTLTALALPEVAAATTGPDNGARYGVGACKTKKCWSLILGFGCSSGAA